jgi:benzoylformate decarboxylase
LQDPSGYFGHRGWALGWGLGCALGVKLAWPERPVVAVLGDGAAVYGIQGLWSAARYGIPVTFVVCNNHEYQILKTLAHNIDLPAATSHQFVGMDLTEPKVDFVKLADSFGVESKRLSDPDDVTNCVRESFGNGRPMLIDVPIERFPAI